MTEPDTITIPKVDYDKLLRMAEKLRCLEDGGVDNWEWYGDALIRGGYYKDGEDFDD